MWACLLLFFSSISDPCVYSILFLSHPHFLEISVRIHIHSSSIPIDFFVIIAWALRKDVLWDNHVAFSGLPSAQISYIPAGVSLQTPTLTPAGDQRYFEYPLTPQPIPTNAAGQLHRDSLLQRSKQMEKNPQNTKSLFIPSGANGLDFFQADPLTAQYLQPTSPSPGLPIAVRQSSLYSSINIFLYSRHHYWHHLMPMDFTVIKTFFLSSSSTSSFFNR